MRLLRAVLLIAATFMLAAPAAALAKGVQSVEVCGADACRAVDAAHREWVVSGGAPVNDPGVRPAHYRIEALVGEPGHRGHMSMLWYPSLHLMRGHGDVGVPEWTSVQLGDVRAVLDRATRGMAPIPGAATRKVAAPAKHSGGGFDVLPWLLGAAAAALVVGVGLVARRRTRIPRFPEA